MNEPKVSVVIPAFNRSRLYQQAIASVLAQTHSDFEIIISDNVCTDDAGRGDGVPRHAREVFPERSQPWDDPNGNARFRRASGVYLAVLEDDNWWHPDYLARLVRALDRHPEATIAHMAVSFTEAQGRVTQVYKRWDSDRRCDRCAELTALMQGNKIYLLTVMARPLLTFCGFVRRIHPVYTRLGYVAASVHVPQWPSMPQSRWSSTGTMSQVLARSSSPSLRRCLKKIADS